MANTHSPKRPKLVAFSYGFLEGSGHSKPLKNLLERSGFAVTPNIKEAQIIIAHSAGCWLIPPDSSARIVVHVGMALQKKRMLKVLVTANVRNLSAFLNPREFSKGLCLSAYYAYYAVTHLRRNIPIAIHAKILEPVFLEQATNIFIANRSDPWTYSPELPEIIKTYPFAFISLPGSHNDIWLHPQRYVDILKKFAV